MNISSISQSYLCKTIPARETRARAFFYYFTDTGRGGVIKQEAVSSLVEEVTSVYKKATGINLDSIIVQTSGGTEVISNKEHEIIKY